MKNVEFYSGLEAKICVRTYKVHYVEETEDYFIRYVKKSRKYYRGSLGIADLLHKKAFGAAPIETAMQQ